MKMIIGHKGLILLQFFPLQKDLFKAFRQFGKVKVNILNNTPP